MTAAALATVSTLAVSAPAFAAGKARPTISEGERAFAALQVQNLMSKHEFYHAAGMNLEEVDALWVNRKGSFASTATFGSPAWVMYGVETVRKAYGEQNQANRVAALKKLSELDPSIKNVPENLGAGHEWAMHTSTTPVIEVAGDGKTAKGIWYSPGMGLMAQVGDGKVAAGGTFFWEKYAGDFVKENGVWKIWHMQMSYDFTPGLPQEWVKNYTKVYDEALANAVKPQGEFREAGERAAFNLPDGFRKPKYSYPAYSPTRPGIIYPPLPQPYYTFKETFNYCNCDQ